MCSLAPIQQVQVSDFHIKSIQRVGWYSSNAPDFILEVHGLNVDRIVVFPPWDLSRFSLVSSDKCWDITAKSPVAPMLAVSCLTQHLPGHGVV
jgi:hypothetical protein